MRWIYLPSTGIHCPPRPRSARGSRVHPGAPRGHRCALGFQGAPWEAKAHPGHILYFQGAPWAIFSFPRRTLAYQGAPWHIKAHLGTSRFALAHEGSPWHTKVRLGFPGCTLGDHWQTKARLGKAHVPSQGAPQATFSRPRRTRGCKTGPGCTPDDLNMELRRTLRARN